LHATSENAVVIPFVITVLKPPQ